MSSITKNSDHFRIYYRLHNMKAFGATVIVFGLEQFKRVNVLKRSAEFKTWLQTNTVEKHLFDEGVQDLAFEEIIDAVRISICFENYMKGILLTKGFLVNELDKNIVEVLALSKEQKTRPIHISELLNVISWEKKESKVYTLKGLKRNTLSYSTMFSARYQDQISLPADILSILTVFADKRNNLHFYQDSEFQISESVLTRIDTLNTYVDNSIIPEFHRLQTELKKENAE